ncbi:MAG: PQQ-dependent sugar dehydrogenase [Planctomycetota bacterium]
MNRTLLLCLTGTAAALVSSPDLTAQTPTLATVRVASGLARPVAIDAPPADLSRLFVCEQHTGLVRLVKDGALLTAPFLDIGTKIRTGSERGLLGIAFHPDYASNGYFYLNYTRRADGATIVERYTVSANPDVANPGSAQVIIGPIAQPFSNHNAGDLAFGPDGYLYIPLGDGGSAGDPACRAQNLTQLLGKMLRIDVDGGSPYAIPPSNPWATHPEIAPEIWSLGWRNPWRFSFDRETGDIYVGDVGQGSREEVSFQAATANGGLNYGWKVMEGINCFSTAQCSSPPPCRSPLLEVPIHDYPSTGSNCSVVGGYVYRGCAIPGLDGTYFFGDYCAQRIWSFRYDGTALTEFQERTAELAPIGPGAIGRLTAFGEDANGEIYVCDLDGELFKIVPEGPAPAVNLGFGTQGSSGAVPVFEVCGLLGIGQSAQFILREAAVSSSVALILSDQNNPVPTRWGTLVPVPPLALLPAFTDTEGRVEFTVNGGLGPAVLYGQWGVLDGSTVATSNALQINFP